MTQTKTQVCPAMSRAQSIPSNSREPSSPPAASSRIAIKIRNLSPRHPRPNRAQWVRFFKPPTHPKSKSEKSPDLSPSHLRPNRAQWVRFFKPPTHPKSKSEKSPAPVTAPHQTPHPPQTGSFLQTRIRTEHKSRKIDRTVTFPVQDTSERTTVGKIAFLILVHLRLSAANSNFFTASRLIASGAYRTHQHHSRRQIPKNRTDLSPIQPAHPLHPGPLYPCKTCTKVYNAA
jgi:hypothetical protein